MNDVSQDVNGLYTRWASLVQKFKKTATGLIDLFTLRPENIFPGSQVTYDFVDNHRTLPKFKGEHDGYDNIAGDKHENLTFRPGAIKLMTNYNIGQVQNRQAGTTIYSEEEKTAMLMSKTSSYVNKFFERTALGLTWMVSEIFQYGQIRFNTEGMSRTLADIDMFAPAGNFAQVAVSWAGGGGTPLKDIEDHIKLINRNGKTKITDIIIGCDALNGMLQNTQVQTELELRRLDKGSFGFEERQLSGFARVGVYNFDGTNVAIYTFGEYYEELDANGDLTGDTIDFIDTNNVIFYSQFGDYQQYYAGVDVIKKAPQGLENFLPSSNITIFGDKMSTQFYIDTATVDNAANSGVFLRYNTKPLCVARTPSYGRLTAIF